MILSRTHYERAFEAYLQDRRIGYVAVDQAKKALLSGAKVKSFDFIVYPRRRPKLLIDVKGRKFSLARYQKGQTGQTWTTTADIDGLTRWEKSFGDDHQAAFVFAWWLEDTDPSIPTENGVFRYDQRDYAFHLVDLTAYRRWAKTRSPRWKTIYIPARQFAAIAQPMDLLIKPRRPSALSRLD